MLSRIFTIAGLYLKTTYTSRATLIFAILMPLLFTFVLGAVIGGGGGGGTPESWPVGVVDQDGSELSQSLIAILKKDPILAVATMDLETVEQAIADEEISVAVVIPTGFGEGLAGNEDVDLIFHQSANDIARAQILEQAIYAAAAQLAGSVAIAELSARTADQIGFFEGENAFSRSAYEAAGLENALSRWENTLPVVVQATQVTRLEEVSGLGGSAQSSPGMLVMFALFFTFGGGASLLVERDEGTLRRLLVMPLGKGTILTGKLMGIFMGSLLQMAIMVLAGQFLFGVRWGQSPTALAGMLLAYGFTGTCLGLMVAALARTVAQANAASTISIMALASLGGAWWPIEIVPPWMQNLALALPTGWAMRGFHDILSRGFGLEEVVLEMGVLIGFGLAFLAIGLWRFEYE